MDTPENSDNSDTVMMEAKRRMAAFIPTNETNITLTPYESAEADAPKEPILRLTFLNGSEQDISVDRLCDRLGANSIDFYCTEGVGDETGLTKKEWNHRATLQGLPVNAYERELPAIYLICSPNELAQKLPAPRHHNL